MKDVDYLSGLKVSKRAYNYAIYTNFISLLHYGNNLKKAKNSKKKKEKIFRVSKSLCPCQTYIFGIRLFLKTVVKQQHGGKSLSVHKFFFHPFYNAPEQKGSFKVQVWKCYNVDITTELLPMQMKN